MRLDLADRLAGELGERDQAGVEGIRTNCRGRTFVRPPRDSRRGRGVARMRALASLATSSENRLPHTEIQDARVGRGGPCSIARLVAATRPPVPMSPGMRTSRSCHTSGRMLDRYQGRLHHGRIASTPRVRCDSPLGLLLGTIRSSQAHACRGGQTDPVRGVRTSPCGMPRSEESVSGATPPLPRASLHILPLLLPPYCGRADFPCRSARPWYGHRHHDVLLPPALPPSQLHHASLASRRSIAAAALSNSSGCTWR